MRPSLSRFLRSRLPERRTGQGSTHSSNSSNSTASTAKKSHATPNSIYFNLLHGVGHVEPHAKRAKGPGDHACAGHHRGSAPTIFVPEDEKGLSLSDEPPLFMNASAVDPC